MWFDALFNYYTSCKYSPALTPNPSPSMERAQFTDESSLWPVDVHVVGKDIIRFHAIFWPAMLASYLDLGEEKDGVWHYKESDKEQLPKTVLTG